eukprot:SAG22_NODE_2803_length_2199_cov_0.931429_1_plen_197_part_10
MGKEREEGQLAVSTVKLEVEGKLRNVDTGFRFSANFETMTQTNEKTGFTRSVRRDVERTRAPLPPGKQMPALPEGVVWRAAHNVTNKGTTDGDIEEVKEEEVLAVRAEQVVQVINEQDDWLFGNILFDPTTEDGGGGRSASSGWFPKILATAADSKDMQKIAQAMGSTFDMGELSPPATWKNDTTRNDAQQIYVSPK